MKRALSVLDESSKEVLCLLSSLPGMNISTNVNSCLIIMEKSILSISIKLMPLKLLMIKYVSGVKNVKPHSPFRVRFIILLRQDYIIMYNNIWKL